MFEKAILRVCCVHNTRVLCIVFVLFTARIVCQLCTMCNVCMHMFCVWCVLNVSCIQCVGCVLCCLLSVDCGPCVLCNKCALYDCTVRVISTTQFNINIPTTMKTMNCKCYNLRCTPIKTMSHSDFQFCNIGMQ